MSTTFEVYPGKRNLPTYSELLNLASVRLQDQLSRHGITTHLRIRINLWANKSSTESPLVLSDEIMKSKEHYLWFFIEGIPGGTDAHFLQHTDLSYQYWKEYLLEPKFRDKAKHIRVNFDIGYYWYFRRSVGQHCLVNVMYGILAASLAELTDGFIFSDDGAWDYERFPAYPSEFYEWYYMPEEALDKDLKDFSENCLSVLREIFNT